MRMSGMPVIAPPMRPHTTAMTTMGMRSLDRRLKGQNGRCEAVLPHSSKGPAIVVKALTASELCSSISPTTSLKVHPSAQPTALAKVHHLTGYLCRRQTRRCWIPITAPVTRPTSVMNGIAKNKSNLARPPTNWEITQKAIPLIAPPIAPPTQLASTQR